MNEPPQQVSASTSTSAPAPVEANWSFLLAHPAHSLALGFGSGLLRPAPGTWGTLAGWIAFVVLDGWLSLRGWLILLPLTFVLGAVCAQRTGTDLGRADHGAIVIDEIVAIWVVLLLLPSTLFAQALGVLAFRVFDILKPPPIRAIDGRYKNGFGVMADDLVAAFYALLVAAVLVRLVR
ncbi:MAG TPA: phosphatidylglycerophosphatase A [Burkholderiaceae bacterium]|nr:phosphatidylglycerophosphatase A [Burkholderiaceae bacterium]